MYVRCNWIDGGTDGRETRRKRSKREESMHPITGLEVAIMNDPKHQ